MRLQKASLAGRCASDNSSNAPRPVNPFVVLTEPAVLLFLSSNARNWEEP